MRCLNSGESKMLQKDILNYSTKLKFDDIVVDAVSGESTYLKITNSKVDSVVNDNSIDGSIFLSKSKRLIAEDLPDLSEKSVKKVLKKAAKTIGNLPPKKDYYGIAEGPFKYKGKAKPDQRISEFQIGDLANIAESMISELDHKNLTDIAGMVTLEKLKDSLITNKEVNVNGSTAYIKVTAHIKTAEGISYQETAAFSSYSKINIKGFCDNLYYTVSQIKSRGKIKNGTYDLIYKPSSASNLLQEVTSAATISEVEEGSFLKGKLEHRIANENVSIIDSGIAKGMISSSYYDDEGYPTRDNYVIENGMLKTYLYNWSEAKKYNTQSTGNAGLIESEPNTLILNYKNPEKSLDSLISEIDKGILITNTWYTRFDNHSTGDFSTVPRDLAIYIERGEPKFAINQIEGTQTVGIRVNDNIIRMLKNLESASKSSVQAISWDAEEPALVPDILVKGVKITTL